MNELEFRVWLTSKGTNKKVVSDIISRLKRIEREINYCDIDAEYGADGCTTLFSYFKNKGVNENMNLLNTSLPIGKYQLSTYKYALKKYVSFLKETTSSKK